MKRDREGALATYRILDLTDSRGAYCAKLLADMGADVIKVESPEGDPGRRIPPFAGDTPHPEKSLYFLYRNTNKRGVTLDISTSEGRVTLRRLIETADVLVENFPPGYMASLGLDYPALRKVNPRLVMASITEFGQSGPYRDFKGSNLVQFALSGSMICSGFPDKMPCTMPGTPAYDVASTIAAISTLIALYSRQTSGTGQYIDTSVYETSRVGLDAIKVTTFSYLQTPEIPSPMTDLRIGPMVYPVYACKDGFIRVAALTPRQWDAVVRLIGSPEIFLAPEWKELLYRIGNADDLLALMTEFTRKFTKLEMFEAAHREGAPVAPILNIEGFLNDPQTKFREFFININHPVAGSALYPGSPYKWREAPTPIRRPAPLLGEHNEELLVQGQALPKVDQVVKPSNKETQRRPLEGIRVISFSSGMVGPDCCKVLGELGADVIKIESTDNLDSMRTVARDGNVNNSMQFNEGNRNKRSFGVNLKTQKGLEIIKRLIEMSDVLVENFRGGVLRSFGLDYDSVRRINPEIIYLSSQGYGSTGPYGEYQAYGPLITAMSGVLSLWSHPDDPYPVGSNFPFPDYIASKHLALAAIAALDYKYRTGKGQFVEMSQADLAASFIGERYLEYTINKRAPKPLGNKSLYAAPYGCYPCAGYDRWCAITVLNDEEWQKFGRAIGNPSWTQDPKYANSEGRLANADELDRMIGEWTATREAREVMENLQRAGIAAGIVQGAADAIDDPQIKHLGALVEIDHPVSGKRLYPSIPFKVSGIPPLKSTRAPLLGEHTDEICQELFNMSKEEIIKLQEEGVFFKPVLK